MEKYLNGLLATVVIFPACLSGKKQVVEEQVFQWTAQKPTKAADAGYPRLPGVEIIHLLQDQDGQMHHLPILQ